MVGLLGISSVLVAAVAHADSWTIWGRIMDLQTVSDHGYRVQLGASLIQNPAGCANSDFYEAHNSLTAAELDLQNRTLLSAFLAGRKVRLYITSASCGPLGRPMYYGVRLYDTQ